MKFVASILPAIALNSALTLSSSPAFSSCSEDPSDCRRSVGAPAPLIGAGLSGVPIAIGFCVYWLVTRRRNHQA